MLRRLAFVLVLAACGGKTDEPPVATRVIGTDKGDPGDPTSGRDPVEDGGTLAVSEGGVLNACGSYVAGFTTDFETGNVADHFTVNQPGAFSIVTANAIDGTHSLAVSPVAGAFLSHPLTNACRVTLAFSARLGADLIASGVKLAQVNAKHHFFSLIVTPGGGLGYAQTIDTPATGDGATLQAQPFTTLAADTPVQISMLVDVALKQVNVAVTDVPGHAIATSPPNNYGGDADEIAEIDFGAAPDTTGPSPTANGTWLLDDVSIK